MKKLLLLLTIFIAAVGCKYHTEHYDFEALRDTLGLDSSCIFVKECSPLYKDNNPYEVSEPRLKTLYYKISYNEQFQRTDTAVFGVMEDNNIVFWGSSDGVGAAGKLIQWTIDNRIKL